MSKVIKLFLLGVSLLSTTAFPMNLGSKLVGRMGAMASRVMPRVKAAAQAGANHAKAAAQNVKANPFPAFCKAVSAGIGAGVSVSEGIDLILLPEDKEGIRQDLQANEYPGGVQDVDERLVKIVGGDLNIPFFVGREIKFEESAEQKKLQEIKRIEGLTYLYVIKNIPFDCAAFNSCALVMSSPMYALLSSPELFIDAQEYTQFCEGVRAVVQHEGGHCLEKHMKQLVVWKIGGPIAIYLAGKRLGPIAKRLLRMNPVAKTKKGMFARAVSGGIAKASMALAGNELLKKHHEYWADDWVDDVHKKYMIEMLYYKLDHAPLWRSKNPENYDEFNKKYEELAEHPRPANRIVRMCGSVERGAELIVDAERQDQRRLYERRKAKMATLETEEEKIAFLVSLGYSPYVSMWEQIPEEAFKGECDTVEEKIAWCLNENAPHWISLRNTVEQDLACAISSVS